MSSQGGNPSKTPRHVQVFFFEKKKPAPQPPAEPENVDPEKTQPGLPFADAELSVVDTDPRLAPPPTLEAAPEAQAAPAPRRRHSREDTPLQVAGDGTAEALEYHSRRLELWMRKAGKDRSLAHSALFGHSLFSRGRLREAQVVFEGLVARELEQPFIYSVLGCVYLVQGELAKALALFEAALQLDGRDPAALVGRAEVRLRNGEPRKAQPDLEKAVRLDANGPYGRRARALTARPKPSGRRR